MKKYILLILLGLAFKANAQDINWQSTNQDYKHIVSLNLGLDFSTAYGISYGYKLSGNIPIVLGTEVSIPFGKDMFDDWKMKLTGQTQLWHSEKLSLSVKPGIILRKYKSETAGLYNIGADVSVIFGYYRPKWSVAGEINYDKAFATHIKHASVKDYYPEVTDGWYKSTGGTFKFGLISSYSFNSLWSSVIKGGFAFGENFKSNPTIPYYLNISVRKKF